MKSSITPLELEYLVHSCNNMNKLKCDVCKFNKSCQEFITLEKYNKRKEERLNGNIDDSKRKK